MIPLLAAAAAPLVKELMAKGLTAIAGAVANKGKEFVEEKLGVKLEDEITTEKALALKQIELDREEDLRAWALENRKLDIEEMKIEQANTADARAMNSRIQESDKTTRFVKEAAYYLDFFIIGATFLMAGMLIFKGVPEGNRDFFFTAFGSLLTLCATIVNFHRGTSARSQSKDATIAALSGVQK